MLLCYLNDPAHFRSYWAEFDTPDCLCCPPSGASMLWFCFWSHWMYSSWIWVNVLSSTVSGLSFWFLLLVWKCHSLPEATNNRQAGTSLWISCFDKFVVLRLLLGISHFNHNILSLTHTLHQTKCPPHTTLQIYWVLRLVLAKTKGICLKKLVEQLRKLLPLFWNESGRVPVQYQVPVPRQRWRKTWINQQDHSFYS